MRILSDKSPVRYEIRYVHGDDSKVFYLPSLSYVNAVCDGITLIKEHLKEWEPISPELYLYEISKDGEKNLCRLEATKEYVGYNYTSVALAMAKIAIHRLEEVSSLYKDEDDDSILNKCINAAGIKLQGAIVDMRDYRGLIEIKDFWDEGGA